MKPRAVILCPRRAGVADRDIIWAFVREWWERNFPDYTLYEGSHDVGPFNRSAAINLAARQADQDGDKPWDVAIIIDADVICEPGAVRAAVEMADTTKRVILAYDRRNMLTPQGTNRILAGFRGNWHTRDFIHRTLTDACSSAVVIGRPLWDDIGGFDERFVGWGWEDVAFRIVAEAMSSESMVKIHAESWHFHHHVSRENNHRSHTFQTNKVRGERYIAAHGNLAAILAIIDEVDETEAVDPQPLDLGPTRIPRILHRVVPANTTEQVETWWTDWRNIHPGWELRTHRDPLDPAEWPKTADLWGRCANGAQLAGLIRLEALLRDGGVYVDSDVEPYRSLEPLLHLPGFSAWEDKRCAPDAVMGAKPNHPALQVMLIRARAAVMAGQSAWYSGPGVSTATLPNRSDWLVLPPGSFYPYHYYDLSQRQVDHMTEQPWCFGAHHWAGSWLSPEERRNLARKQKPVRR